LKDEFSLTKSQNPLQVC